MLINNFKSLRPISFGLLVIIAIGLWLFPFFGVHQITIDIPTPLYSLFTYWLGNHLVLNLLISLTLVITEAIMLNNMIIKHQLLSQRTYIPALFYMLLMSCIPETLTIHPILFCNFFIIITLNRLFSTYRKDNVSATCYDAGLFLGIAVLFYYPVIFLFPIVLISLALLRPFEWKEWASAFLGLATPHLFLFTYLYCTGTIVQTLSGFPSFSFMLSKFPIKINPSFLILAITVLAFIGYTFNSVINEIKSSKIKVRKMFAILVWFALLVVILVICFSNFAVYSITILSIPIAIYFSAYFVHAEKPVLKEIIFIIILGIIVYVQVVNLLRY